MLDSDSDGLISAAKVNIEQVSNDRLAILAPLLTEMEEKKVALDESLFEAAVKRLLKYCTIDEKRILLGLTGKTRSSIEDMINLPFRVNDNNPAYNR